MPVSVRSLAERMARNVVFKTRMPARYGRRPIWLSPGNHLAVLKFGDSKFVADLLNFVERFVDSGDVVWDIGANMGLFALPAATRAAHTIAFEPDPFNVRLIHRTMAANPDLKLDALAIAVSDEIGVSRFNIPVRGRSSNGLAHAALSTQTGGVRQQFSVMTVTADWLLEHFPAPDFVKCDAEGAESMILRGAPRLLGEARPVIVIEMARENAEECAAIFARHDYVTMSAYEPVAVESAVSDISDLWDVLAIPREKLAAFVGR
jgi:FkbM family methyltransferase